MRFSSTVILCFSGQHGHPNTPQWVSVSKCIYDSSYTHRFSMCVLHENSTKCDIRHCIHTMIYFCPRSPICDVLSSVEANTWQFCNSTKIICILRLCQLIITLFICACFKSPYIVLLFPCFSAIYVLPLWRSFCDEKLRVLLKLSNILHCIHNCETSIVPIYLILEPMP